ncbi:VOC family protein [Sphingomonas sp. C3-2]|uniref:VOC family protein n=1 Tax=Sphingomonas sp. C3-2 TaxID=3062169 RepID=UPI00294B5B46|nr:VOC family protein [Sphingomonas sp. C3-2]WOK36002.1 VOC family protein [Sphingomonas sp. C3-2]
MADKFGFTKLLVADLEKSAIFYKTVFELTELARVQSSITGREISEIMFNPTGEGAATFVLLTYVGTEKPSSEEVILGFITEDLEALLGRVTAAGGAVTQPIKAMPEHGIKVAFATDPEGHLLELVEMLGAHG